MKKEPNMVYYYYYNTFKDIFDLMYLQGCVCYSVR